MSDEPRVILHQKFGRIHFIRLVPLSEGLIIVALTWWIIIMINLALFALNLLIFLVVTAFTGSKAARIVSTSILALLVLFGGLVAWGLVNSAHTANSQQAVFDQTATANPTSIAPVTNTNSATPSGSSTTTHISVDSTIPPPGVDTGIVVNAGDQITIAATGWITYGTNPDGTCDGTPPVNPDGQRQYPNGGLSCPPLMDPYTIAQNVPIGVLLAGVFPLGTSGTPSGYAAVGSHGSFIAQSNGHLYLLVNESTFNDNGGWTDNAGSYQATVTITPA